MEPLLLAKNTMHSVSRNWSWNDSTEQLQLQWQNLKQKHPLGTFGMSPETLLEQPFISDTSPILTTTTAISYVAGAFCIRLHRSDCELAPELENRASARVQLAYSEVPKFRDTCKFIHLCAFPKAGRWSGIGYNNHSLMNMRCLECTAHMHARLRAIQDSIPQVPAGDTYPEDFSLRCRIAQGRRILIMQVLTSAS